MSVLDKLMMYYMSAVIISVEVWKRFKNLYQVTDFFYKMSVIKQFYIFIMREGDYVEKYV